MLSCWFAFSLWQGSLFWFFVTNCQGVGRFLNACDLDGGDNSFKTSPGCMVLCQTWYGGENNRATFFTMQNNANNDGWPLFQQKKKRNKKNALQNFFQDFDVLKLHTTLFGLILHLKLLVAQWNTSVRTLSSRPCRCANFACFWFKILFCLLFEYSGIW